jgi:hypothetical protein
MCRLRLLLRYRPVNSAQQPGTGHRKGSEMPEGVSLATDSAGDAGIGVDEVVSGAVYRVSDHDTA